jgi:hypothetical protein
VRAVRGLGRKKCMHATDADRPRVLQRESAGLQSLLRSLADHAVQVGGPGLSRNPFISGALRELGVTLCRSNASLVRSGLCALTRVSGWAPLSGLSCLSAEVV